MSSSNASKRHYGVLCNIVCILTLCFQCEASTIQVDDQSPASNSQNGSFVTKFVTGFQQFHIAVFELLLLDGRCLVPCKHI